VALLVPFVAQLLLPPGIGGFDVRMTFTVLYVLAAVGLMLDARRRRAVAAWPQSIVESLVQPGESRRTQAKPKGGRTAA
jgi:hypothetical protein